mgnify:CR=1 FL=1
MASESAFELKIITPDRVFYEGMVEMVEFNTTDPLAAGCRESFIHKRPPNEKPPKKEMPYRFGISLLIIIVIYFNTSIRAIALCKAVSARGFKEILEGKHDDVPESYFLNAGSIDDVVARKNKG